MSKKNKKLKYSAAEKRAYWIGVGFHAGKSLDMRSEQVYALMSPKEKDSFVNGRTAADDLSEKFVPDLVSGKRRRRKK